MKDLSIVCLLMMLFAVSPTDAQTAEQITAFNEAWAEYQQAVESASAREQVATISRVVEIGRSFLPDSDPRVAALMVKQGQALIAVSKGDEAVTILKGALKLDEDTYGKDSEKLVTTLTYLGDAYGIDGAAGSQSRSFKRALKLVAAAHGDGSVEYANLAMRAGSSMYTYARSDAGLKYIQTANEIYTRELGADSLQTGMTEYTLSKLRYSQRRYGQSIEHGLLALQAYEAHPDESLEQQLYLRALLVKAYEEQGDTASATQHCVAIGRLSEFREEQENTPLFRMAPSYPRLMLTRGVEGHVDVEFSINEDGFVRDPRIIASKKTGSTGPMSISDNSISTLSSGPKTFDDAALKAVERFRYAPRFENGEPVVTENVKTRISFTIED